MPRESLVKTGDVDHADWNHRFGLGYISRRRFELVRALLPERRVHRLLEVGYGSGVFFPELAKHADELYGIDPHDRASDVEQVLHAAGIAATLRRAPAEAIPFDDGFFDVAVCVSALEFVDDLARVARELARVLAPGGSAIVVTPAEHPIYDLALRVTTGKSAREDFGDRRHDLIGTLTSIMPLAERRTFPSRMPPGMPHLYTALRLVPRRDPPSPG